MTENNTTTSFVTPYQAAKLVNLYLALQGVDKTIPPQMMYNYTKARINADKKPFIKYDEKKGVEVKDLERWVKEYTAKLQAKLANTETAEA